MNGESDLEPTVEQKIDALRVDLAQMADYLVKVVGNEVIDIGGELRGLTDFVAPRLDSVYNEVMGMGAKIGDAISGALDYIGEVFGWVGETLNAAVHDVQSAFESFGGKLFAGITALVDNLTSVFAKVGDIIGAWISDAITEIRKALGNVIDGLKTAFQTAIDFVTDKFSDFAQWLVEGFKDLYTNINEAVKGLADALTGAIDAVVQGIIQFFTDLKALVLWVWEGAMQVLEELYSVDEDALAERIKKMLAAQVRAMQEMKPPQG